MLPGLLTAGGSLVFFLMGRSKTRDLRQGSKWDSEHGKAGFLACCEGPAVLRAKPQGHGTLRACKGSAETEAQLCITGSERASPETCPLNSASEVLRWTVPSCLPGSRG